MQQDDESNEAGGQIDLGEQNEPMESGPIGVGRQPSYPTVMLSGGPALQHIPDKGHVKFKHRVIARHQPHGGNPKHKVELELMSLHKAKAPKARKVNPAQEDGSHMKKLLEGVQD